MGLLNEDLQQLNAGSGYKFSATKVDALGASEYTLASIVMDASTSIMDYAADLEAMLKTILKALDKSPRRDNLMLRLTQFASTVTELHGFKQLGAIKETDYNGILNIGGNTAGFDAMDESIQATATYGKQLMANDFLANGVIFVVFDGQSNVGNINSGDVAADAAVIKKVLQTARKAENLESILLILIGITRDNNGLDFYLQTVKDEGGFDQYVSIGTATPGKLAKLADFVSQSISSTSTALGSGAASTPLPATQFKF